MKTLNQLPVNQSHQPQLCAALAEFFDAFSELTLNEIEKFDLTKILQAIDMDIDPNENAVEEEDVKLQNQRIEQVVQNKLFPKRIANVIAKLKDIKNAPLQLANNKGLDKVFYLQLVISNMPHYLWLHPTLANKLEMFLECFTYCTLDYFVNNVSIPLTDIQAAYTYLEKTKYLTSLTNETIQCQQALGKKLRANIHNTFVKQIDLANHSEYELSLAKHIIKHPKYHSDDIFLLAQQYVTLHELQQKLINLNNDKEKTPEEKLYIFKKLFDNKMNTPAFKSTREHRIVQFIKAVLSLMTFGLTDHLNHPVKNYIDHGVMLFKKSNKESKHVSAHAKDNVFEMKPISLLTMLKRRG